MKLIQGNEACALGAMQAGCRFFAGYPITPATEIMEWMARLLPPVRGVFIQMEDEIAALAAVIGASWGGAKAMTATSGPGFSLMQEHIGYAAMTETPCVIVDSQRGGPSTGLPTLPAQGDVMQARWGSHGDRAAIVLTASTVRDVYEVTVAAFNLSETYRVPVVDRRPPGANFQPFAGMEFQAFGDGAPFVVTGLAHAASGRPRASDGPNLDRMLRRSIERIDQADDVIRYRGTALEDAEHLILAYGITARSAAGAVQLLRAEGVRAGLLELQTLWPFPEALVADLAAQVEDIVVAELNLGQLVLPVRAAVGGAAPVRHLGRADGTLFSPEEIAAAVRTAGEVALA